MNGTQAAGALIVAFDELNRSRQRINQVDKRGKDNALRVRADLGSLQNEVKRRLAAVEAQSPKLAGQIAKLVKMLDSVGDSANQSLSTARRAEAEVERTRQFAAVIRSVLGDVDSRFSEELKRITDSLSAPVKQARAVTDIFEDEGHLIVKYSDGSETDLGKRKRNVSWVVDQSIFGALNVDSITFPTRALNTTYTAHATKSVLGIYTVQIGCDVVVPLLGTASTEGHIQLLSDKLTASTEICRARKKNAAIRTLAVDLGLTLVDDTDTTLSHIIPPGHLVQLKSTVVSGAPTFSIQRSCEIIL